MGIDSDAEKDLELSDTDADNVIGGHMDARKKIKGSKHTSQGAAVTSFTVSGAPLTGDPGTDPGTSQAEMDSDPDC
jgi:hypothetical protein